MRLFVQLSVGLFYQNLYIPTSVCLSAFTFSLSVTSSFFSTTNVAINRQTLMGGTSEIVGEKMVQKTFLSLHFLASIPPKQVCSIWIDRNLHASKQRKEKKKKRGYGLTHAPFH